MSNTLGTERGTSSVTVISLTPNADNVSSGLDDDSTTTGIIIIAVSLCPQKTWFLLVFGLPKDSVL